MNYQTIYNNLIEKRKLNPVTEGYKEKHHILPKSLGGTNDKSNLVALTGREHWVAHLLLHKIHKRSETAHACNMMAMRCEERGITYIKSSRLYEHIRKEHAKYISKIGKARIGEKNGAFGTMWISNIESRKNAKIKRGDIIPDSWVAGKNKWNEIPRMNKEEFKEFRSRHMIKQRQSELLDKHQDNIDLSEIINDKFLKSGYTSFSKFAKENHKNLDLSYGSMYKYKNYKF
jgi:hypothetical protein